MGIKEWLVPQERKFFDMLEQHARQVQHGAELLLDLLEHFKHVETKCMLLKDAEHKGDAIVHDIYEQLNTTFITPIDREDITALTNALDDVLDFTYKTGKHLHIYNIKEVPSPLVKVARLLVQQTKHIHDALKGLRNLGNREAIRKHLVEINKIENLVDDITNSAIAELFRDGQEALDIIKLKDIYNYIESAADKGEDCANVIGDIIVKYS